MASFDLSLFISGKNTPLLNRYDDDDDARVVCKARTHADLKSVLPKCLAKPPSS